MISKADISKCERYRYALVRIWDETKPILNWCMLNPSTADADVDDPTIRRCVGFSKRWGYGGIRVVNLFALRATNPRELKRADDPVGPENEKLLRELTRPVVVGWGASIPRDPRADYLVQILKDNAKRQCGGWFCLGKTKAGEPRHPLMLSYSVQLEGWPLDLRGGVR